MERYQRHTPLYSEEEFREIRHTSIAVAGCGGLGSTVLQLLARIGFGTIHFWDNGYLDSPDLNRQFLYKPKHIGESKIAIALSELKEINPELNYIPHFEKLSIDSKIDTTAKIDLVIDCLDSFASRLVLDKLFFDRGIPIIHGSAFKEKGQITSLIPEKTANYQSTFGIEDTPEEEQCKTIFPPVVTTVASIQITEALKYIGRHFDKMLINKVLIIDLRENKFETISLI
ncbi:MAG: HesA/MoeB/ThiF family protein [Bacteroidales bacterium]|nr:HesA/MoeB/ThiF family protein [Bacteroidales bacterium]